ncbi:hypothetical protein CCAX7_50100 [Capsulimonas corticalis]|uniref:Uncharacterized protein n=1 Tax=Capsulimonas corticalis TaxID=2219043 RepID=A0A402CPU1_9BACT|nr:DinB family protein [Capsulimonas corticalis]BDI32959.1 hypothetical protein CCAX7_50100 [Capsulimonas corticalis]
MFPYHVHKYLMGAVAGTPDLFDYLLLGMTDDEADFRPDPERFTLREAITHVADWDEVFLGRLNQTVSEDYPTLVGLDEGQVAIDRDYAHADWRQQLVYLRERRPKITALLRDLSAEQWERAGNHTENGRMTIADQAVMIAAHDNYHIRQIADFRAAYAAQSKRSAAL